jgi:putative hydroxymethylpyrimidine transport system permease protein
MNVGIAIVVLLLLWHGIVKLFAIPSYLFPSPVEVGLAIMSDPFNFLRHTVVTSLEAIVGLWLALTLALAAAAILGTFQKLREAAMPLVIGAQAVPIVAIAPIVVLWLGPGLASKVVMAAILCWFPAVMAATRGLMETEVNHVALFDVYRASRWDRLMKLRLPSGVTHVTSGIRVSAGLAMIGAIVAEYVGADKGLGYMITQASYRLDTDRLFAAVTCGAVAGVLIAEIVYTLFQQLFRRFLRR